MFHCFPFQQPDRYFFDLENLTKLLPAISKIHALHKTRHIANDADNAVLIAVAQADRIRTIRAIAKVHTVHKARYIPDDADDPIVIPVVKHANVLLFQCSKILQVAARRIDVTVSDQPNIKREDFKVRGRISSRVRA